MSLFGIRLVIGVHLAADGRIMASREMVWVDGSVGEKDHLAQWGM